MNTTPKPYLIRAINEWVLDNGFTPHLLVSAEREGVSVPAEHVQDGKIVLNIHPDAVRDLSLENDYILFSARFSGRSFNIEVPVSAVQAIYARENGEGMSFPEDATPPPPPESSDSDNTSDSPEKKGGHLKLVK